MIFYEFYRGGMNFLGGGEVSGGGTLYMKWRAGRFGLRRECSARADRETHTHINLTHSSPLTQ